MPDPIEKAKDVASGAAHPVETSKGLASEADRGRSARTPAIALTGVSIAVAVIVAIILALAITLYFVYGGR